MHFTSLTNFKNKKKILYFLILFFFSISFNQYYGYRGILPIDSFIVFNSGYDILNGYFPFKDYWTTTGPLVDLVQAFFFKIFGVSWFSYVLHASFFNFIITITTFYTLLNFKLNINFCLFYALMVSILSYPTAGTPFMDHHSAILSIVAILTFILALKTQLNLFWFFTPIILGLAFLSKQVPAAYIIIIVTVLSTIHFYHVFNVKRILLSFLGIFTFIILFLLILITNEIPTMSFIEQYILFPKSIGNDRLDFIFPLEFQRVVLRFKLIYLSLLIILIVIIKNIAKSNKYLKNEEFLILTSLISTSIAFIIFQLMIINAKFIFFIIPILIGFSHIYYKKYLKHKNYILYFLVFLSLFSTLWYQYNYNHTRKFMDLNDVDMKNAIDAEILDKRFNNLKWITVLYPDNPKNEILKLKKVISTIKKDKRKKVIVTDYQFISVLESSYDFSPNRVWDKGVAYPEKGSKYFEIYKKFIIDKLKKNNIEVLYEVKPLWGDNNILETILNENCVKKTTLTDILDSYLILNCEDLKN